MSWYDVLGVSPRATPAEIRRVYVDLARRHHPDVQDGDDGEVRAAAERRMQRINEAWYVLGDDERRRAYDQGPRGESATSVRRDPPRRDWRPIEELDPDEPDPRDLIEDQPYGPGSELPRALQLVPPGLVLAALLLLSLALVTGGSTVLALALVCGLLGFVAFLTAPFVALLRSRHSERLGSR
jgi:hypothetical protein